MDSLVLSFAEGVGGALSRSLGLGPIIIQHDGHVGVLENGTLTCMSAPADQKLCLDAHASSATVAEKTSSLDSEGCCEVETAHVCLVQHACNTPDVCLAPHFHSAHTHGEISEEATVHCREMTGCVLPMTWRQPCSAQPAIEGEHDHHEGCGHERVPHGDHFDFLLPLDDGSYLLRHYHEDKDGPHIDDHGRLVKAGIQAAHELHTPDKVAPEGLGLRRRGRKLLDIFNYESPAKKYYVSLPDNEDVQPEEVPLQPIQVSPRPPGGVLKTASTPRKSSLSSMAPVNESSPELGSASLEQVVDVPIESKGSLEKTMLDVLGICCPSEVPLIKRILEPLPGVVEVSCNVPAKTTTVMHDPMLISDLQLVNALNEARLEASIHRRGQVHKAPVPGWNVWVCGVLLVVALFHSLYDPLKYVALGAIALGLPPILLKGLLSLRRWVLDINSLMSIATGGAIAIGDYTEGAAIVFLFSLADWMETRSSDRARQAIAAVMSLAPETAVLADSGQQVRTEDVDVGTLLAVRPGQLIPIDGVVDGGSSTVNESSLTGESLPVPKNVGQDVWAGTVNLGGYLRVKTTALAKDSATSRMVRLVEEAQSQRSQSELLVEKFARVYTPTVVLAAVILAVVPLLAGVENAKQWIYLALVLLVVACPCALVISTPMVSVCGIAQGARTGMLIKGGIHLESLGKLKVLAMDKTGTLTEGNFRVVQMLPLQSEADIDKTLTLLAAIEAQSSHPLAAALVAYARLRGVETLPEVTGFEVLPGEGVKGVIEGQTVHTGNTRMAEHLGWQTAVDHSILDLWASEGGTVGWVGTSSGPLAVYSVADQPRPEASAAVRDLQGAGLHVVMLTGDNDGAASAIKDQINKNLEVHAGLLPRDKVDLIVSLKSTRGVTGMVGDGINDAPALAAAHVGVAMGVAGTAVAMETADCALMTNDLRQLARAVHLGRKCRRIMQQNVVFALVTKVVVIVLSVLGYSNLWLAVVADVGASLAVIFNSMRVLSRTSRHTDSTRACVAESLSGHPACSAEGKGKCCSEKTSFEMEGSDECRSKGLHATGKSCCEKEKSCCQDEEAGTSPRGQSCCETEKRKSCCQSSESERIPKGGSGCHGHEHGKGLLRGLFHHHGHKHHSKTSCSARH